MHAIDDWRRIGSGVAPAEFADAFPHPFLVSVPAAASAAAGGGSQPAPKVMEFRTITHERVAWSLVPPDPGEPVVLPLKKAPNTPFPERISIGRAPNCDLVLREPSVSKLHGHFRDIQPDRAIFSDAKSANGTRLDGTLVEPGVAVAIHRHCVVELGRVQLLLLSATDLYTWLHDGAGS